MVLGKIIQRIQSLYSKGVQSDDSRLSSRHIYNKIVTLRSKLVAQEAKKRQKIGQWNFQTINCAELIKAPVHECPCIPAMGLYIYRTKYKLPEVLTDLDTHLIQSVTSLDGQTIYGETTWKGKKYKAHDKYASDKPDYFIRNGYLYITGNNETEVISITALFDDPVKASNYSSYCNECNEEENTCLSNLDLEFPMESDLIDTLVEMASVELISKFNQSREDVTNNSNDNIIQESK